jgi:hypothetical protein
MLTEYEYGIHPFFCNKSIILNDKIKEKGGTFLINYDYKNKQKNNENRIVLFRNKGEVLE